MDVLLNEKYPIVLGSRLFFCMLSHLFLRLLIDEALKSKIQFSNTHIEALWIMRLASHAIPKGAWILVMGAGTKESRYGLIRLNMYFDNFD